MNLSINCENRTIYTEVQAEKTIAEAARGAGAFLPMPCGGRGRCGKCAVLVKGDFPPVSAAEAKLLKAAAIAPVDGYDARIACLCGTGEGDVIVPGGGRDVSTADFSGDVPVYDGEGTGLYGAAIDVGTTTISAVLFPFDGGAASAIHEMNRQAVYGADVLSRIDHSDKNGVGELRDCLTAQLNGMISRLTAGAGIDPSRVERVVAVGNTTMMHYLTGLDPGGIGTAPFTPESLFGEEMAAAEIFPGIRNAVLYIPPSVSAYIGSDITCGVLATGMTEGSSAQLLVDVGTNGEMALYADSRIICCATAAGPAFEGASIAMGMPAVSGAISRVSENGGEIAVAVINGAAPAGICGSGMISAVNLMLNAGALDGGGRILRSGHPYERLVTPRGGEMSFDIGGSGVFLTQKDIRNIQLAKASIAAGISVLLKKGGVGPCDIKTLHLSGGFGSTIDPSDAAGIGLIPPESPPRTATGGNTALAGAARLLFSRSLRLKITEITSMASEISLSSSAEFMEEYVERMPFRDS
jgi:uncharacterized 2Fe-2S/4Fe-4S cluster protein (DUF4445 family)